MKQLHRQLLAAGHSLPQLLALPLHDPLLASYLLDPDQEHGVASAAYRLAQLAMDVPESLVRKSLAAAGVALGDQELEVVVQSMVLRLVRPKVEALLEEVGGWDAVMW